MTRRLNRLAAAALAAAAGCSGDDGDPMPAPGIELDVPCIAIHEAADPDGLRDALAAASPGECVVVAPGTYAGSVTVPAGVTLAAPEGAVATIVASEAGVPGVRLVGAEGTGLRRLRVEGAPEVGVQLDGGPALLSEVEITAAGEVALLVSCTGEACTDDAHAVVVEEPSLHDSGTGLWALGARVQLEGGEVADNAGPGLDTGYGIIASGGAVLEVTGTAVLRNEGAGVLVDGGGGTRARLTDVRIADNEGRGVWAQHLGDGVSIDPVLPMLEIDGAATAIEGNGFVGVGVTDSIAVRISGGRIAGTLAVPTITANGFRADIGDGVGIFGSSAVELAGVDLANNARAQVLVDAGGEGIAIRDVTLEALQDQLRIVIQNTPGGVDAPANLISALADPLPVDARGVALPSR